jgi:chemotaxis protein MotB
MAGKGGGAWKVAYADFVTAMMAFFMVMWITAQSKNVKQAIAHYFNQPTKTKSKDATTDPPTGSGDGASAKRLETGLLPPGRELGVLGLKRLAKEGNKGNGVRRPTVSAVHDGDRRMDGTVVTFAEDSAELTALAKDKLKQVVPLILGKQNKIELRGHATRRPLPPGSPYRDAWELCYARGQATMGFLQQQGIPPERIRLSQAGVFEPYSIRVDPEKRALNARVELYVLAETADELMGTREERAERLTGP